MGRRERTGEEGGEGRTSLGLGSSDRVVFAVEKALVTKFFSER